MSRSESAVGYPAEFKSILESLGYQSQGLEAGIRHWNFSNTLQEIRVGRGVDIIECAAQAGIDLCTYLEIEDISIFNKRPIPPIEVLRQWGQSWSLPSTDIDTLIKSAGYQT